jgi:hypothetical protein
MKNKTNAIKIAQEQVGKLFRFGNQWKYLLWMDDMNSWYEMNAMEYYKAIGKRSQHLIDRARSYLGLDLIEYDGGDWKKYLTE